MKIFNLPFSIITTKKAFTLVEAMIFMLIMVLVAITFYRTAVGGISVMRDARARIAASDIANEKMEILRNLAYENLGTINGTPTGLIPEEEQLDRSNVHFLVKTEIRYSDDDYDGSGTNDPRPNDYKQVQITVIWNSGGQQKQVSVLSHIAPPGTEDLYNGGILSIDIRHASDNQPVAGARVIVTDLDSGINIFDGNTSADGKVYLIGLTPKNYKYKITVLGIGYYPVTTLPPYNLSPFDPRDRHASVTLAGIWQQTIYFDKFASLKIKTQDPLGNAIGNIDFALEGGRDLGSTRDTVPMTVYSYPKTNKQTDTNGEFMLNNESAGSYNFYWPNPSTANNGDYKFWKVWPMFGTSGQTFLAAAGLTTDVSAILLPVKNPSLFLTVTDSTDGNPISDASVKVEDSASGYSETAISDQFGKVYFPNNTNPIVDGTPYHITVNADSYQEKQVDITVDKLTEQTITIDPI